MSSSLLELEIEAAFATSDAIGSPDGELKHRKRYELLGYSSSIAMFRAKQSSILFQLLPFESNGRAGVRTNFLSENAALVFV
jgi:hypothetical protein